MIFLDSNHRGMHFSEVIVARSSWSSARTSIPNARRWDPIDQGYFFEMDTLNRTMAKS